MNWLVYSLSNAFFESCKDVLSKKFLKSIDEYIFSWSLVVFTLPFLLLALIFLPIPRFNQMFWLALLVSGSINTLAIIWYMKAIKTSDLSLAMPMLTFSPLFLLLTSFVILKERPQPLGIAGVLLIVIGSYILNINNQQKGLLDPFLDLIRKKGSKYMLGVSLLWSVSANFDKIGITNTSPFIWFIMINLFLTVSLFPLLLAKSKSKLHLIKNNIQKFIKVSFFRFLSNSFQFMAIGMTFVVYAISVKRLSVIFSVVLGHFVFKEKNVKSRIVGASIMFIGAILITLS